MCKSSFQADQVAPEPREFQRHYICCCWLNLSRRVLYRLPRLLCLKCIRQHCQPARLSRDSCRTPIPLHIILMKLCRLWLFLKLSAIHRPERGAKFKFKVGKRNNLPIAAVIYTSTSQQDWWRHQMHWSKFQYAKLLWIGKCKPGRSSVLQHSDLATHLNLHVGVVVVTGSGGHRSDNPIKVNYRS